MMGLEGKDLELDGIAKDESVLERDLADCRKRCQELEVEIEKVKELWCSALEAELEKEKTKCIKLYGRCVVEKDLKAKVENELSILKERNKELEEHISGLENVELVDLSNEEGVDKYTQLMIENKVLECEKLKAERETEFWKSKCRELELKVEKVCLTGKSADLTKFSDMTTKGMPEAKDLANGFSVVAGKTNVEENKGPNGTEELEAVKGVSSVCTPAAIRSTASLATPCNETVLEGGKGALSRTNMMGGSRVKKQLFERDGSPGNKMAPCTPAGARPASAGVIPIDDSDNELDSTLLSMPNLVTMRKKKISVSTDCDLDCSSHKKENSSENNLKRTYSENSDEEDMAGHKGDSPLLRVPKETRLRMVLSDSGSDQCDDKLPIAKVIRNSGKKTGSFSTSCSDSEALSGEKNEGGAPELHRVLDEKDNSPKNNLKRALSEKSDREDMDVHKCNSRSSQVLKKRRVSNMVLSDSESDERPISKIIRNRGQKSKIESRPNSCSDAEAISGDEIGGDSPLRRLVRKCEVKDEFERKSSVSNNEEDVEDDEVGEDTSSSEGESLGGFIVDGSDVSESVDASDDDLGLENSSDGGMSSCLLRNRDKNSKWVMEADMLADFGKDTALCMKAVCALYRQQTGDEKRIRGTICSNQRGFNQFHAKRGSKLAEFLTEGDLAGDLVKTMEELREYDSEGPDFCWEMATHYSKQLFDIYKKNEDPLWCEEVSKCTPRSSSLESARNKCCEEVSQCTPQSSSLKFTRYNSEAPSTPSGKKTGQFFPFSYMATIGLERKDNNV